MSKYFKDYDAIIKNGLNDNSNLFSLKNFKTMTQKADNNCGPCCAIMTLKYFKDDRFTFDDENKVSKMMKTRPYPKGTNLSNMVKFFLNISNDEYKYKVTSSIDFKKDKDGNCFSKFKDFRDFVIKNIKENKVIIVENVDYGGHYQTIIGYDKVNKNLEEDMLIFADPSDFNDGNKDGITVFPAERFFYMWFDDH